MKQSQALARRGSKRQAAFLGGEAGRLPGWSGAPPPSAPAGRGGSELGGEAALLGGRGGAGLEAAARRARSPGRIAALGQLGGEAALSAARQGGRRS